MTVTRRRLLGGAAAAGLAAALPAHAEAKAKPQRKRARRVDVAVVGGGLAGLTAARELVGAGKSVVVLEARDRVGGRTLNHQLAGGAITEAGGQFVGPTQNRILALADRLGVRRFPGYNPGDSVYISDGRTQRYTGDIPPDLAVLPDLALLVGRVNELSRTIPVDAPWTAPDAGTYDRQTIDSWLRDSAINDPRSIAFINLFLNSAFGGEASDASLLFFLAQVAGFGDERTPGTIERGIGGRNGAQDSRFVGGSQLVSIKVAEQLGRRVVLRAPVRRIEQRGGRVTVVSDRGSWQAQRAIVAVPPPLAVEIEWQPLLPPEHDALRRRMPLGTLSKCEAVYDEPFWRKDGLNGMAIKLDGTVRTMFDNTPPEGRPGILMGFLGGHQWRLANVRSPEERRALVLADFAAAYGARALKPKEYFEQDWTRERWTRGGPVSVLGTGTLSDFGPALARPVGRVHWAGTETASYWNGYMDGAVRSGERAAREVLDAL